jgi:CheY-like chemotaxis protein
MATTETRRTVLVVDDNRQLLEFLTDALEELGDFRVVTAADGVEGLARYFALRPKCMIIDVRMPGIDGYQLVRALRGDPDSADTPLIILSAMAQDRDQLIGLFAGADIYLQKPVRPLDLIAAIERAIALGDRERAERMRLLAAEEPEVAQPDPSPDSPQGTDPEVE